MLGNVSQRAVMCQVPTIVDSFDSAEQQHGIAFVLIGPVLVRVVDATQPMISVCYRFVASLVDDDNLQMVQKE